MNELVQAVITTTVFLPLVFGCGGGDVFTNTVELNTTTDITNANYILQRIDGVWSAMSTGTDQVVRDFSIDRNTGRVYLGGDFSTAGGDANCQYVAQWDGVAFSALGPKLNQIVYTLAVAPNGDVYIAGSFTADIDANPFKYIVRWDGTSWNTVGAGLNGSVYALAIDSTGLLYIGGNFTDIDGGGLANANYICTWDGTNYAALGTGMDAIVYTLSVAPNDDVYIGGAFTQAGGAADYNRVCYWDGAAFQKMSTGSDDLIGTLVVGPEGLVYMSGLFTALGGLTVNTIAGWDGNSYFPMVGDVTLVGNVYAILPVSRNEVIAAGYWTATGDVSNYLATWNGSSWIPMDLRLPGVTAGWALAQYGNKLYLGHTASGTATTSGIPVTTINHTGTTRAFPTITITRSGGTTATLESIQNLTTGKVLLFNHALLDGERIVIDLTPGYKTITTYAGGSTNNALNDMLPGSDFGTFALAPGVNDIGLYISETGSPTLTAFIQWQTTYPTIDGAL